MSPWTAGAATAAKPGPRGCRLPSPIHANPRSGQAPPTSKARAAQTRHLGCLPDCSLSLLPPTEFSTSPRHPHAPAPDLVSPPALSFQTCRTPGGFTRSAQSLLTPPTSDSNPEPPRRPPGPAQPRTSPAPSPVARHSTALLLLVPLRPPWLLAAARFLLPTPPRTHRSQLETSSPPQAAGTVPHTWGGLARVLAVSLSVCCPWRGQGPRSSSDVSARPAHRRCSGHAHE